MKKPQVWLLLHLGIPLLVVPGLALPLASSTGSPLSIPGILFLMGGVLFLYAAERFPALYPSDNNLLREELLRSYRPALVVALLMGFLMALLGFIKLGTPFSPTILMLSGLSLLYPFTKQIPALKNFLVPTVWWIALFNIALEPGGAPGLGSSTGLVVFLLLFVGVLFCDLKEESHTETSKVEPTILSLIGLEQTLWLGRGLLLAIGPLLIGVHAPQEWMIITGLLLGLSFRRRWLKQELLGPSLVDAALALPGLIYLIVHL